MSQRFSLFNPYCLTVVATLSASPWCIAESEISFDIPAQPLADALLQFSETSGIKVFFSSQLTDKLRGNAVQGRYLPHLALQKLLAGTGVVAKSTADGTITLDRGKAAVVPPESAVLGKVTVTGKAEYDDTDPYNPDYNRPNASTATKTDTPIMETPFSVQVVPKQVLDDQQAVRVEKALQNVSGVTPSNANGGGQDAYVIRGFFTQTIYRDGVQIPDLQSGPTTKRETANVERVEVLKGPGSLLFGRAEPGGIINLVTKQPLTIPFYSLQQQFGSFDFYRTTVDATGPVTKDDTLLYRFNLAYENAGSFRDFHDGNERIFFAPVLTWNISPRTKATLEYEFQHVDERLDNGVPPLGNRPAPVPRERSIQDAVLNRNVIDRNYLGFHWSHAFNEQWTLSQRFGMDLIDQPVLAGSYVGSELSPDGTFVRPFYSYPSKSDRYYTSLNLTGKFSTWDLKHTLLIGGDYYRMDDRVDGHDIDGPDFNVFNPVYLTQAPQFGPTTYPVNLTTSWHGVYFQDQIELPYHVFALGGFRYDSADIHDNLSNTRTNGDTRVSPRGGLVWRPIPELSLYGSYTENFGASNGIDADGQGLPPQTAQQWETGIKTELWGGRLTGTLAYFDLIKQHLTVADPANPVRSRAIGEAESRGLEFDLAGEILPGWRLIGSYSYLPFAKITDDGAGAKEGNRLFLAPRNAGSLWSTYEFQYGELRGLKFGAGLRAVGQREGNPENSFELPGYTTVNLMASYGINVGPSKVLLQLNVDNLIDKNYFLNTNSGSHILPGAPRTFLGSVRVDF
ncbi:TonB-dependent receptor [Methylococcus sp. EFPC2]|uniref:TonB-dependent siderophore receptor n=1 Tax=Methylococcus sp. EFPC2 TaxID=2812648 RepID=UPI0019683109|nr:TonB-dependent receptor [Methylococcus sp. EFPC2]QSA96565.1 TonB-dependent receptor [Methylococcus sp. EFPC2]